MPIIEDKGTFVIDVYFPEPAGLVTSWTRPDDERLVGPLEMEGGVAAEGRSECGDDQVQEFEGEPEAEAGQRNPVKVQDPQLPSATSSPTCITVPGAHTA